MSRKTAGINNRISGFTLIEVLLVTFILALTALVYCATFPTSQISRMKATHATYAISLATQKVEELKSAGYSGILVGTPTDTPVAELPNGTEHIAVSQYSPNVKRIEVTINWSGYRQIGGNIKLVTFVSDHS